MGKRHIPDLVFHADRSERLSGRIDELLTRTRRRNKYPQRPAPEATAAPDAPPATEPAPAAKV